MSELKQRVITGVIGSIVLIAIILQGGLLLQGAILLLSLEVVRELYNAFRKINITINIPVLIMGCLLLFGFHILDISLEFSIIAVLFLSFITLLFKDDMELQDVSFTLLSFIYGPYLLNLLYGLEQQMIYLVFIIAFSTDTFAYFVGSSIGKHKLIPKVSPNKSIEGSIGGVLGCLILTLIYFKYINLPISIVAVLFIIVASISGQVGDLIASKIKRVTGIKDYAKILPGHGGILDRFDSTILVIPFVYMLQYFLF